MRIAGRVSVFILLFHFKRISLALVNLSSMSLCIFGAAVGLCITGYDVSLTCVLGVVSLMGILVRNGIIMLDYAEELRREKGLSVRDAAFQAGERRMRPIFLTSAAASVGVLPMMLENAMVADGRCHLLRHAHLNGAHRHRSAYTLLARVRQARQVQLTQKGKRRA